MLLDPYNFKTVNILEIKRESQKTVSVRLDMPKNYHFLAGQHTVVRITLPDGTKSVRQYSFSSAPNSGEAWLTIVETEGGVVSSWFNRLARVGNAIEISKPFSGPLIQKSPRGEICLIAGGSGIAPLMSILRENRLETRQPITLLYSAKSTVFGFAAELSPFEHEKILIRLTDKTGRFNEEEIKSAIKGSEAIYICGSRAFVMHMRRICQHHFPATLVYSESFSLE